MLKRVIWRGLGREARREALRRPALAASPARAQRVAAIMARVREEGDAAVLALTEELDGVRPARLEVGPEALESAWRGLDRRLKDALRTAAGRITDFHAPQRPVEVVLESPEGTVLRRRPVPLSAVGLYAPAGSAPLPSSVLMTAIPAGLAGCPLRALAAPPGPDGEIAPVILAAARLCGVERVFRMGGAQAVAALAYGTETVPKTAKIFGPGNAWVAEAKRQAAQDPDGAASDMPAGPSEVMVAADDGADPAFAAADLLSQAEHGPDSQAILVAVGTAVADRVEAEVRRQLETLPRREIAAAALSASAAVVVADAEEALEAVEAYAPEHLILQTRDAAALAGRVRSAGAVFVGAWSPEAAGDYASGPNHVLPTYGAARWASGLGVEAFTRWMTVQTGTREGLAAIAEAVETLAAAEGLEGHRRAVALRLAREAVS